MSCNDGRLRAKEAEVSACEKKLLSAESQVNELQARLNDAVNQRRHWEDEYNVSSALHIHLLSAFTSEQLQCICTFLACH